MVSMFCFTLGGFDGKLFYMSSNEYVSMSFFIVFESVMAVMLLNLFIAVVTDSYTQVSNWTVPSGLTIIAWAHKQCCTGDAR